ncbi:MAG: M20/M25/M40 family metallo-hydrolase, partial [Paracoccaceae bacterium]
ALMGAPAYGIAPGHAQIRATLRTLEDAAMDALCARAEALVHEAAQQSGLGVDLTYEDVFLSCENAPAAVRELRAALEAEGVPTTGTGLPMRASEDFGRFGKDCPATLFLLGAGEDHPSLHNPDYDFPDDLIRIGARIFMRTIRNMLG